MTNTVGACLILDETKFSLRMERSQELKLLAKWLKTGIGKVARPEGFEPPTPSSGG